MAIEFAELDPAAILDLRFRTAVAAKAAKLSPTLIQAWIARGHVNLKDPNPGTGKRRVFTRHDVIMLRLTAELVRIGLPIDLASRLGFAVTIAYRELMYLNSRVRQEETAGADCQP